MITHSPTSAREQRMPGYSPETSDLRQSSVETSDGNSSLASPDTAPMNAETSPDAVPEPSTPERLDRLRVQISHKRMRDAISVPADGMRAVGQLVTLRPWEATKSLGRAGAAGVRLATNHYDSADTAA